MRTSSRCFGSKSTRSSSLVAAWSRWFMALANAAAWESKSSRSGIVTAASAASVVVMPARLVSIRPRYMVHLHGDFLGQLCPRPRRIRSMSEQKGAASRRRAGDTSASATSPAAGLDLHIELAGPRVRAALEDSLRAGVQTGRLAGGMRLPASRTLAADLGIARNTVVDAYGQLVAEGWLTARQGSGTRVAEDAAVNGDGEAGGAPPAAAGTPPAGPRISLRPG